MKVKKVLISLTLILVFVALSVFSRVGTVRAEAAKKKYALEFSNGNPDKDPLDIDGKLLVMRVGDRRYIGLRDTSYKYGPLIEYNDESGDANWYFWDSFVNPKEVKWSVGNKKIVKIIKENSTGYIWLEAKKKGKTTISATYKGKTYTCKIHVKYDIVNESHRVKYTPEREKKVQKRILSLMEKYPAGSYWGSEHDYQSRLNDYNAPACTGFAWLTAEYGENYEAVLKRYLIKEHDLSNIHAGDIIYYIYRYNNPDGTLRAKNVHYATVIGKEYDEDFDIEYLLVVDGNITDGSHYGIVRWDNEYFFDDYIPSKSNSFSTVYAVWSFWDTWEEYDGYTYEEAADAFEREYRQYWGENIFLGSDTDK